MDYQRRVWLDVNTHKRIDLTTVIRYVIIMVMVRVIEKRNKDRRKVYCLDNRVVKEGLERRKVKRRNSNGYQRKK